MWTRPVGAEQKKTSSEEGRHGSLVYGQAASWVVHLASMDLPSTTVQIIPTRKFELLGYTNKLPRLYLEDSGIFRDL